MLIYPVAKATSILHLSARPIKFGRGNRQCQNLENIFADKAIGNTFDSS